MGRLDGVELGGGVPFEEHHGNRLYNSLLSVMVALFLGLIFSYLFDEKVGVFVFVQAIFSGMASLMRPENSEKEPYIIGDSNEIVYLTKKELEERLKKKKTSLHDL
ncbi:hypothetical protein [Thermococcus sp. 5-4]|uniref:hypothetical protein n=1 Tax=Thermococcus sp. 5-4 TaxID=2008440 RepID=UPI000B4A1C61|nr:hypothetical protein [Thermococcus sp. 5-4]ASA78394.1 hypothetical protein CDI07_08830 [Thermococcus sp. 5-4]